MTVDTIPAIVSADFQTITGRYGEGKIDYSDQSRRPVVEVLVKYAGQLLMLRRSNHVGVHQNLYSGVSGYYDMPIPYAQMAAQELDEELCLEPRDYKLGVGLPFEQQEGPLTWVVHPGIAEIRSQTARNKIRLDCEHSEMQWVDLPDVHSFIQTNETVQGFKETLVAVSEYLWPPVVVEFQTLRRELESLDLFTPEVERAVEVARYCHRATKRDNGSSYLNGHIYPVVWDIVKRFQSDEQLKQLLKPDTIIRGLCHDSVESGKYSLEQARQDFGDVNALALSALTKPEIEDRGDYNDAEKLELNRLALQRTVDVRKTHAELGLPGSVDDVFFIKLSDRGNNIEGSLSTRNRKSKKFARVLLELQQVHLPAAAMYSQDYYDYLHSLEQQMLLLI